jgi:hypothetical protein
MCRQQGDLPIILYLMTAYIRQSYTVLIPVSSATPDGISSAEPFVYGRLVLVKNQDRIPPAMNE